MKLMRNKFILIVLCLCLISTVGIAVNIFSVLSQESGAGESLTSGTGGLTNNGIYEIPSNPTSYQKELYNDLTDALKGYSFENREDAYEQELLITELIVKNFIADFYTWTNKSSSYDVGGTQFIFSDSFLTFQQHARDSFYADLDGYIEQIGRENLIEVKSIEAEAAYASGYTHNGVTYSCFYVQATWEYKDCSLDTKDWQNGAAFHVIYHPETERWEIAQFWNLG